MGIGLMIIGIVILILSFFTPIGVGTGLLLSIILIILGIVRYRKQTQ